MAEAVVGSSAGKDLGDRAEPKLTLAFCASGDEIRASYPFTVMTPDHTHGIPPDLYQTITAPENTAHAVKAMEAFLHDGDEAAFEYAVALYVASARYRQEPVEVVVGALCTLAEDLEGPRSSGETVLAPSKMHELVFSGILKAFYGVVAVERAHGASMQRRADAPQHLERGTWPRRPSD